MCTKRMTVALARQELSNNAWDVLVVDLDLPDAVSLIGAAVRIHPAILATFTHLNYAAFTEASSLGLPLVPRSLFVNAPQAWLAAVMTDRVASHTRTRGSGADESSECRSRAGLSPREAVIFSLLTRGRAPKDIAHELGISHETVRTHARKAYHKMGVSNLREAMAALLGE